MTQDKAPDETLEMPESDAVRPEQTAKLFELIEQLLKQAPGEALAPDKAAEQLRSAGMSDPVEEAHYSAPDGTQPVPDTIWARLDDKKLTDALAVLKQNIGGNGHLEFRPIFQFGKDEEQALAEVGGSSAVRRVTEILSETSPSAEVP